MNLTSSGLYSQGIIATAGATLDARPAPGGRCMSSRLSIWVVLLLSGVGLGALQAAAVSQQQADAFSQKMASVKQQGTSGVRAQNSAPRRTSFTESELNSWFAYRSA